MQLEMILSVDVIEVQSSRIVIARVRKDRGERIEWQVEQAPKYS